MNIIKTNKAVFRKEDLRFANVYYREFKHTYEFLAEIIIQVGNQAKTLEILLEKCGFPNEIAEQKQLLTEKLKYWHDFFANAMMP